MHVNYGEWCESDREAVIHYSFSELHPTVHVVHGKLVATPYVSTKENFITHQMWWRTSWCASQICWGSLENFFSNIRWILPWNYSDPLIDDHLINYNLLQSFRSQPVYFYSGSIKVSKRVTYSQTYTQQISLYDYVSLDKEVNVNVITPNVTYEHNPWMNTLSCWLAF